MVIVAGQAVADAQYAALAANVPGSTARPGCYESEALCRWQSEQRQRGFRSVEIVCSIYGHSVRSDTGLDNFMLLASSRCGDVDGTLADAIRWAAEWCAQDPSKRYAWHRAQVTA